MKKKKRRGPAGLLKSITDNYLKTVAPHQLYQLDEHTPIINTHMQPIGYFHPRCYEELLKLVGKNNLNGTP